MAGKIVEFSGTKHSWLADQLKNAILSGHLKKGELIESESQLCRRFNISRGPVRQALASLERERLVVKIPGKGSFVAETVRPPPNNRKNRQLCVIMDTIPNLEGNFCMLEIIEALNHAAERLKPTYKLTYEFHRFTDENDPSILSLFNQNDHAGFLIVSWSNPGGRFLTLHQPTAIPIVTFFQKVDAPSISQIYIDQETAAFRATDYLIHYGHKRIGLLLGSNSDDWLTLNNRLAGYRRALESAGIEFNPANVIQTGTGEMDIRSATSRLIEQNDRPTAIIIGGGLLTGLSARVIRNAGFQVPRDMSIIAFDDIPDALVHDPPLSVIKQPLKRGAELALGQLVSEIEHPGTQPLWLGLKPEVIIRESCAEPPESK
jgi:DNA-binding LacI/PurR family transcriptional regulator